MIIGFYDLFYQSGLVWVYFLSYRFLITISTFLLFIFGSKHLSLNLCMFQINKTLILIINIQQELQNLLVMRRRTIEFINSHPLNKSKTKEAHSFSKSPRFSRVINQGIPSYYDLSKSAVQLRPKTATAVFSKAKRFRQVQLWKKSRQNEPSPHSYKSPDFVQLSTKNKKGVTFPQSPKNRTKIERLPGPGQYKLDRYNPERSPSFSISRDEKTKNNHWNRLGPGEYQNVDIKKPSSPATIGKAKRFKYKASENPAPGQYYETHQFNQESRVHANGPKFSFGSSKRSLWVENRSSQSPGPGSYNNGFSQFSERSQRIFKILNRL